MNFLRFAMLFVGFAYLLAIMPVMGMDSGMGLGLQAGNPAPSQKRAGEDHPASNTRAQKRQKNVHDYGTKNDDTEVVAPSAKKQRVEPKPKRDKLSLPGVLAPETIRLTILGFLVEYDPKEFARTLHMFRSTSKSCQTNIDKFLCRFSNTNRAGQVIRNLKNHQTIAPIYTFFKVDLEKLLLSAAETGKSNAVEIFMAQRPGKNVHIGDYKTPVQKFNSIRDDNGNSILYLAAASDDDKTVCAVIESLPQPQGPSFVSFLNGTAFTNSEGTPSCLYDAIRNQNLERLQEAIVRAPSLDGLSNFQGHMPLAFVSSPIIEGILLFAAEAFPPLIEALQNADIPSEKILMLLNSNRPINVNAQSPDWERNRAGFSTLKKIIAAGTGIGCFVILLSTINFDWITAIYDDCSNGGELNRYLLTLLGHCPGLPPRTIIYLSPTTKLCLAGIGICSIIAAFIVNRILKNKTLNQWNDNRYTRTPLSLAVEKNDPTIVRKLLELKANPNTLHPLDRAKLRQAQLTDGLTRLQKKMYLERNRIYDAGAPMPQKIRDFDNNEQIISLLQQHGGRQSTTSKFIVGCMKAVSTTIDRTRELAQHARQNIRQIPYASAALARNLWQRIKEAGTEARELYEASNG